MINIDNRILDLVPTKIKPDDFFVLLCIAKRINCANQSFPSRMRLQKETGFGKNKITTCLDSLCNAGVLEREQRAITNNEGRKLFSSNLYTITTEYLSVFVNLSGKRVEVDNDADFTVTDFRDTEIRDTENRALSIKQNISINHNLKNKKKETNFDAEKYIHEVFKNPELIDALLGYLEIRKIKKYPTTQRIVDTWKKEITLNVEKTGSLDDAFKLINRCTESAYRGLNFDWLQNSATYKAIDKVWSK